MENNGNIKADVCFAALNSYAEQNIISPREKYIASRDLVEWGDGNRYPDYLIMLYRESSTLGSVINGNVDYICGDGATFDGPALPGTELGKMNKRGDSPEDQIRDIALDFEIYGGFALQVIRNLNGDISEVYWLDLRHLRTNKEADVFYYCEDWSKPGRKQVIVYPKFMPNLNWQSLSLEERKRHASSIVYVNNTHTQVYPSPIYRGAVKACELERLTDDFHINSINNQFTSSAVLNFNNGIPEDRIKEQIEKDVSEKFSGAQNAGRILVSWSKDKEHAVTIDEFKVEDFGERYKALEASSRQKIFTAFRAIPLLFGLTSESNTGFSTNEFEQSFRLYNRTQIRPVQLKIARTYEYIFGRPCMSIKPFTLEGADINVK